MWTSKIFFSLTIFLPLQLLHRSLGLIRSPCPWHSIHTDWICCTIPGPIWWILICMPVPLQLGQHSTAPFLPPRPENENWRWVIMCYQKKKTQKCKNIFCLVSVSKLPSHLSQITFFCSASFLIAPLYISSKLTDNWWTTFLPVKEHRYLLKFGSLVCTSPCQVMTNQVSGF